MTGPLLVIRDADGAERTVELRDGVMRIGRGADNEIIIGDAAKGVSRAHAELHIENGRCTIVDLHSQNGTWVNALRVQRAEVRPDQEIAIGVFRLRLQTGTPSVSATGRPGPRPQPATVVAPRPPLPEAPSPIFPAPPPLPPPPLPPARRDPVTDLPLMSAAAGATSPVPMPAVPRPTMEQAPAAKAKKSNLPLIYGVVGALVMIALAIALFSIPQKKIGEPAAVPAPAAAPAAQPAAVPATPVATGTPPPAPEDSTRRSARPAATRPAATTPTTAPAPPPATSVTRPTPNPPAPPAPGGRATPAAAGGRSGPSAARTAAAVRTTAENLPVPRKPGETVQEWQARSSALQARYAFAKVALDRGDFSAAAGGFAAILLEEPGFLDAPQLLVKAREGLRTAAVEMIDAGNKLDATGDWVSALKKYDQAREIDRSVPGVDDAVKRVRDKMHAAGGNALRRARQFDALGRFADALTEYEKAAQWLSPDDPNQQIARGRADQLKARQK
jgi:predicted component of type VI protein secretion system